LGDGGMDNAGGGAGLAQEAAAPVLVPHQFGGEQLKGYGALQLGIVSVVDHPHAALAEDALDVVMVDGLAHQRM
jgi:hypothetical protein